MDVVGVEGCSDLVDVAVDESLNPCHDSLGLGAFLGGRRNSLNEHAGRRTDVKCSSIMTRAFYGILGGVRGITSAPAGPG